MLGKARVAKPASKEEIIRIATEAVDRQTPGYPMEMETFAAVKEQNADLKEHIALMRKIVLQLVERLK